MKDESLKQTGQSGPNCLDALGALDLAGHRSANLCQVAQSLGLGIQIGHGCQLGLGCPQPLGFRSGAVAFLGELGALLGPILRLDFAVLVVAANTGQPILGPLSLAVGLLAERSDLGQLVAVRLGDRLAGRLHVEPYLLEVEIDGGVYFCSVDGPGGAEVGAEREPPVAEVVLRGGAGVGVRARDQPFAALAAAKQPTYEKVLAARTPSATLASLTLDAVQQCLRLVP